MRPAKTQISLGIRTVLSESSLAANIVKATDTEYRHVQRYRISLEWHDATQQRKQNEHNEDELRQKKKKNKQKKKKRIGTVTVTLLGAATSFN